MALVFSNMERSVQGNKYVVRGRFALDSSYPAGGYPFTGAVIGHSVIESFVAAPRLGYEFDWDVVNKTLRVYRPNDLTLVGGQAVGDVVQVSGGVLGKTTAGTVIGTATAPVEVATGTDLSAVTNATFRTEGV